jgi:hypothetical protein
MKTDQTTHPAVTELTTVDAEIAALGGVQGHRTRAGANGGAGSPARRCPAAVRARAPILSRAGSERAGSDSTALMRLTGLTGGRTMRASGPFAAVPDALTEVLGRVGATATMNSNDPPDILPPDDAGERLEARLERDLLTWLEGYINGTVSLHELRAWISDQPFAIFNPGKRLMALYGLSHSRIIRFDYGSWSQDDLKQSIRYVIDLVMTGDIPAFADPMQDKTNGPRIETMRPRRPDERES